MEFPCKSWTPKAKVISYEKLRNSNNKLNKNKRKLNFAQFSAGPGKGIPKEFYSQLKNSNDKLTKN